MPKKEFRIVASTGDNFYQFYYIIQMPAGDFYHGMVGSDPSRTSIHTSGQINWHYSKGKQISFPAKQKLTELRGIRQLCSMSIGKLVFQNPHFSIAPSKTKVNGLVYFDIRKFKADIGLMIFLLEPGKYDKLTGLDRFRSAQIHIITETNPWLVILVHECGSRLEKR